MRMAESEFSRQARAHRRRAELFMQHATETNNPNTRAMYLRLAGRDGALAKQLEREAGQEE
jgi:hypothetical protein